MRRLLRLERDRAIVAILVGANLLLAATIVLVVRGTGAVDPVLEALGR